MKPNEVMEMAREAGWSGIYTQWAEPTGEADWSPYKVSLTVPVTMEQIEAFAALAAAKEREKWAEVEAYLVAASEGSMSRNNAEQLAGELLAAIRARGQA